ncbi:hypothetical protein [Labilibaculum euxinus]
MHTNYRLPHQGVLYMNFKRPLPQLAILILSYLLLTLLNKLILPLGLVIESKLSDQLDHERLTSLLQTQQKIEWFVYLLLPIAVAAKIILITFCFKIGAILNNTKKNSFIKTVIFSEYFFIGLGLVKSIWFFSHKNILTIEYVQNFHPFALINLFDISALESWIQFPLQTLNLFEVIYWFILTWLISKELKVKFWKSFEFVMSTYGIGLLIWVVFVMFLTINMN